MPDVKQILVVDDHFEMLEFLRSMLETQSQDFQVLGVPSAEEGWLEFLRTPFDLLITDLRLPGMSGFDLVRRASKRMPELPIIVITAYASEQGKQEAVDLGVFRYFEKPLDTDSLIASVRVALGDEAELAEEDGAVSGEVRERIEKLRSETTAAQVILADITGQVLLSLSDVDGVDLDMAELCHNMAHNMRDGLLVADRLGGDAPFNVQYHAGSEWEMYSANIGRFYFVSLFFAVEARRSRFSMLWVYLQRTVTDLYELLPEPESLLADELEAGVERDVALAQQSLPEEVPPFAEEAPLPSEMATPAATKAPTAAVSESETEDGQELMSLEEAMSLGDLDLDFISNVDFEEAEADEDLEAFWEDAISDAEGSQAGGRLSIDEARRQGLLSSDFDINTEE